jgi:hypothetical protein
VSLGVRLFYVASICLRTNMNNADKIDIIVSIIDTMISKVND